MERKEFTKTNLIGIVSRSCTSLQIAHIASFLRHNERPFKLDAFVRELWKESYLTGFFGIDSEVCRKFHWTMNAFWDVDKRTVRENGAVQCCKIIVIDRHHASQIFSNQVRIFFYSFRKTAENDTRFRQLFSKCCRDRDGIEHGIDRYVCQSFLLIQRDSQPDNHTSTPVSSFLDTLVKRGQQFWIHFVQGLLLLFDFRFGIIRKILVVDRRICVIRPFGFFHR